MPKRRVKRHSVVQPLEESYRLIPLTQGQNAIVDVGDFEWLSKFNWYAYWHENTNSFYAAKGDKLEAMHRFILGCKEEVDHADRNTLNNRRNNLRKATKAQNMHNRKKLRTNTSGFIGVYWYQGWKSKIANNGKRHYLGIFSSPEEAARAYDEMAKKLHGEFAFLNFPDLAV